ncbi:MAG TPA: hypothetical protein VFK85_03635, partial [Anaeromyxobacteraceae bacterium]|nr:hypothetical protein [Anaeromyxobacteraceae bacterium]
MCPGRSALDPIGIIEAAYAWCDSDEDWLRGIAAAARALDAGSGVSARLDDVTDIDRPRLLAASFDRFPDGPWRRIAAEGLDHLPAEMARALYRPGPPVGFACDRLRELPAAAQRGLSELFASWGWADVFGVFARDVSG